MAHVPYYEATEDLYVSHPEAGVMPVAAFRAGDRVTADLVKPNGWEDKVRVPDAFASPPEPASTEIHPQSPPEFPTAKKIQAAPAAGKE